MSTQPTVAPLVVRTVEVTGADDDARSLLDLLPADSPLAWVRDDDGLIGWGEVARFDATGPDRFAAAEAWWKDLVAGAVVRDEVGLPGTGPVAFGSFAFDDTPGDSVLVVPQTLVAQRAGRRWVTTISAAGDLPHQPIVPVREPVRPPGQIVFSDGARDGASWEGAVRSALGRIAEGAVDKVVLARDLVAEASASIDIRWPLDRLASRYPRCWTFSVDSLVGATPELLVRRERGLVTSRVLAGTIRRTGDDEHDLALAASLARSSKDLEEHEYAVRSVAEALGPHCDSMIVSEAPYVLHLPNVMHLASDLAGVSTDRGASLTTTPVTSLGLAEALHPSAAVGGTPVGAAVATIRDLEGMDRGRYAGPVGWIDAAGDGEWGIALRCAQVDPHDGARMRLFAGCGIVAGSDPAAELAESVAKLVPMRDALGG